MSRAALYQTKLDAYVRIVRQRPPSPSVHAANTSATEPGSVDNRSQDIIDVDTLFVHGPEHFLNSQGTALNRIDVDAGTTTADGIVVKEWAALANAPDDGPSTSTADPATLPSSVVWSNARAELKDIFVCCICLFTLQKPVVPLCMHIFCYACIRRNLRERNVCPVCRSPIREPPIRDNAFEMELYDAICDKLVDKPTAPLPSSLYDWSGVVFAPDDV
ncbi:hypothetical protein C8J57DRAFT_1601756 [Mycena rebaudengoi]|nr:hypothetical protein C8J57DRAFT_1601756 [Mycena rebaudengoi]